MGTGDGWGAPPVPRWADTDAMSSRQPRARATRRALLVAAARLVDERGYHGTSLNDVAAAAGTTKGAVYFHFTSKHDVMTSLFEEVSLSWDHLMTGIDTGREDPLRTMLRCYDAHTGGLMYDVPTRAVVRVIRDTDVVPSAQWVPRWHTVVADLLRRAHRADLIVPQVDPDWLGRHLPATVTGHFHLADSPPHTPTMWERMNDTWTGLLPAIAPTRWVEEWRESGWTERPAPVAADYERSPELDA